MIAAPEVGAELTGVIGGSEPIVPSESVDAEVKAEDERQRKEDDLIMTKAILGHSLHEIYSNHRIQLAIGRKHVERMSRDLDGVDVCEIFSPERVTAVCKQAGLVPGEAMDIKSGYDFDLLADRQRCWKSIVEDEPLLIIGSPPCTLFSRLQELNKHMYRNNEAWLEKFQIAMEQAKRYVRFCVQVYEHQR